MAEALPTHLQEAQTAILASIEAFGDAAADELVRWDVSFKDGKANLATLHRRRRAEVKRISEAFSRACTTQEDRNYLATILEVSLKGLDDHYKDFRRMLRGLR